MSKKDHKEHKSKMRNLFKKFRASTTDLSEWSKNDEKLMKAVDTGDLAKIDSLLIKKSLNPTKLGPKGLSVFHVACTHGSLDVVDLLISHGAEVNVLSIQGNTSVQLAARDGWPKVLEKLIEAGGVIDHKDGMCLTALHHACVRGQVPCVQVLLKHGADPNSRDKAGKPPLFYAAYSGCLQICKDLLDKGANINAHDEQNLTPLMAAAKQGSVEVCELLLKKGADANFCDVKGQRPIVYALDNGHENLREIFERAPTRASWDVTDGGKPTTNQDTEAGATAQVTVEVEEVWAEPAENQENMVAKFVPEATPEMVHRQPTQSNSGNNSEVIQIAGTKKTKEELDDEAMAERAAAPPQSVLEQRALEAYKELEEENEHMHEDLKNLTAQHKRLQEAHDAMKKQLSAPAPPAVDPEEVQELEEELTGLKSQLTEEQDKNVRLFDKMKKLKKKLKTQTGNEDDSGDDSWNDSDDELFETPANRKPPVIDHKPQTLLLLQNQVAQLRQDNKLLRERLQKNGSTLTSLFGRRDKTGSISSLASIEDLALTEFERQKHRLEELERENKSLHKQLQEDGGFSQEERQNVQILEQENTQLHTELKQLRTEVNLMKLKTDGNKEIKLINGDVNKDSGKGINGDDKEGQESAIQEAPPANISMKEMDDIHKENEALRAENTLLTEELESLRDTYNKLVIAGDNLQDMYDQLVQEKEQVLEQLENAAKARQELAKENEYLLADGNAMHDDIERLVQEVEKLHDQNQELERKVNTLNQGGKASDFARVVEERDKYKEQMEELEKISDELKQNHDIVLEEVQSLQGAVQQAEFQRDQVQQEFDSLQDEFENLQGSSEGLQQDYTQLEQDYSDLLADKEKLEQEFLEVQTASVNVESSNPVVVEERDKLAQDNEVLVMEKEQLEMTMTEMSKSNALLQEELANLKDALKMDDKDKKDRDNHEKIAAVNDTKLSSSAKEAQDKNTVDNVVEKDRRIRSLQIQISRLQQQLAEADGHYRDVISTYRTHLLSAVQGHMDPDVKQALYNIIELRSMEQYC